MPFRNVTKSIAAEACSYEEREELERCGYLLGAENLQPFAPFRRADFFAGAGFGANTIRRLRSMGAPNGVLKGLLTAILRHSPAIKGCLNSPVGHK